MPGQPQGIGGIEASNLSAAVQARLAPAAVGQAGLTAGFTSKPGDRAINVLRIAANVADTETVTIGADTYEMETVATAAGGQTTGAGGMLNNTTNPIVIPLTLAALTVALGDPIAVENEIMKVHRDLGANGVVLLRGRYGTTVAAHGNAIAINKGNGITAGRIPVGFIATFTPAVAGPAIAAEINNAAVGGERAVNKASTIYGQVKATSLQAGAEVVLEALAAGVLALATTETLAGANNAWNQATMYGGSAIAPKREAWVSRAATAQEVALGTMQFSLDFTPTIVTVDVTTAARVPVAWVGAFTITGNRVTVDNSGATDFSATDIVRVFAQE